MAKYALASATLEHTNGIPKDRVVNTFAIDVTAAASVAAAGPTILACIASFYNDVQASGASVASFLSHGLSRAANACIVRTYDITNTLDGTPHGSPVHTGAFQLGAVGAGTSPMPEEVAMAITLRADQWAAQPVERVDGADPGVEIDRPRQRYSGRIFIGPLTNGTNTPVSNIARPNAGFRTTLLDAAEGLYDDLKVANYLWSVWSRVDADMRHITDVQVDDAFDTQRRRGAAPTVRTNRVVVP